MGKYCYISVHAEWPFLSTFSCLHDIFLTHFQPDLLNFKKGWMVKLDEQGQVFFHVYPWELSWTFPRHVMWADCDSLFNKKWLKLFNIVNTPTKCFQKQVPAELSVWGFQYPWLWLKTEDRWKFSLDICKCLKRFVFLCSGKNTGLFWRTTVWDIIRTQLQRR